MLEAGQQDHIFYEIKYMAKMKHPLVTQMRGVAQDSRNLYILMEYLQHGELLNVVKKVGRMNKLFARFYTAQICLIFEWMHSQDLIYRDLKPENVLVQSNGYVKLTDFGFVKRLKAWDRTYTLCGTPEYIAPEVILNVGHGRAADWYTLGIFIYELMMGRPPFMHQDTYEVFKMTLREQIPFERDFSSDAKSLIRHLCDHDLSKRYGNLVNGSVDIRNHRFFKTIDWAKLKTQQFIPPYTPRQKPEELRELQKAKGMALGSIPESKDDVEAPEISKTNDLFREWF